MDRESIDTIPIIEVPRERRITKEDFQTACEIMTDIALTTTQCLADMETEAAPFDRELQRRCVEAREKLDAVVAHIVARVS